MKNRKQRREANKVKPAYQRGRPEEVLKHIYQHGITADDLRHEFIRGKEAGAKDSARFYIRQTTAAVALALHRELGFGPLRIRRIINAMDHAILEELTTTELIDKAAKECGLENYFKEREEGATLFD